MNAPTEFEPEFEALTGHRALCWQIRLYGEIVEGRIPPVADLPTGLGKTSVIPIWLIALAHSSRVDGARARVPRRLVYVVNRRTVVDQATDVVEQMRERLNTPSDDRWRKSAEDLKDIVNRLRAFSLSSENEPLGVSTLRGERADNEEWKTDPARPAIIIGTIDMVGSKLLFSGYGDRRYSRAHHAGLIGQDVLIVHDEAHLTPAFSRLLWRVERHQRESGESRAVYVLELSATRRAADDDDRVRTVRLRPRYSQEAEEGRPFLLLPDDEQDKFVRERLDAVKRLHLQPLSGEQLREATRPPEGKTKAPTLEETLASVALRHGGAMARVLVYVGSPEHAQGVTAALRKKLADPGGERVALLTGTIRGHERDRLVKQDVFRALLHREAPLERTLYLVSTSAGEVGIDLDADHMVCDLTTLDSLIQRLGRVNRSSGPSREARVDVVWENENSEAKEKVSPTNEARAATLRILKRWVGDSADGVLVGPRRLRELLDYVPAEEREAAFAPKGTIAPLTDILLDNWSLTSFDEMPGRPEVAAYLHGLTTDPPETYVAWRRELRLLERLEPSSEGLSEGAYRKARADFEGTLRDWFAACRIEARERLRDTTGRVRKKLGALLEAHRKRATPTFDFPVVLLDERGRASWSTLSAIVKKPENNQTDVLWYRTVVLPVEIGGLNLDGALDAQFVNPADEIDVADTGLRERWLHSSSAAERYTRLATGETAEKLPSGFREKERITLTEPSESEEDDADVLELMLLTTPAEAAIENPETARFRQTLSSHTQEILQEIDRIARALNLDPDLHGALVHAAQRHDRGKDRPCWQYYAWNEDGSEPVAKSTRYRDPRRALSGYRHEFGSLVEAMAASDFVDHPERDLILHLIAAHHGWARPHFEPRAYDREGPLDSHTSQRQPPTTAESQRVAVEMLQRFGRLQQRFGRWGLASLESLLRCADIAASRRVAESTEGRETTETSGLGNPEPARDQAYGATVLSTDTSSPPDARPVICAGGVEEPSFGIEVDVTNPGQFFACCGLLELAHRLWPGAQGWFGNGRFFVAAPFRRDASPLDLLSPLLDCSVEVAKGTQDEKTAPLELGSPILLHLDWWLDGNGKPTPFKTWAANATSRQMFCKWRDPLKESLRAVAGDFLALLQLGTRLQGSYGFDSHLGWDALRVGFSLNEHVGLKDLPTRPVIELVGAIGLQRFLPRLDRKQYEVRYSPWGHPLSAPVARVASIGLVQTNGSRTLRTRFVSRGSFKGLDAASTFQGEFDE